MSTPTIQKALHEIVILAAGRAATQDELDLMLSLEGNGNWAPLINVINSFMSNLAESSGSTALVKAMALNGTAVTLTDAAAAAKAAADTKEADRKLQEREDAQPQAVRHRPKRWR